MGYHLNSYMLVYVVLTLFNISYVCLAFTSVSVRVSPPAIFVFGDSQLDAGNNNYINTMAKANFIPYGIDFGEPTGRFTNGRTMVDILGQQLGVKGFIQPYLAPDTVGATILKGVNYASATSGILNETGKIFRTNIQMDAQIDNFANTRQSILSLKGKSAAINLLRSNSLFIVAIGSNDFVVNYLLPIFLRHEESGVPIKKFISTLIKRLRLQLEILHSLDARKFVVANIGALGCLPFMIDTKKPNCNEKINEMIQMFNSELKKLISELKRELKGSVFIYVDVYRIFSHIIEKSESYGFENIDSACCQLLGKHGGLFPCIRYSRVCEDRSKYVFWDAMHPTEATNQVIAKRVLDGQPPDVSPMNVRQLLKRRTY